MSPHFQKYRIWYTRTGKTALITAALLITLFSTTTPVWAETVIGPLQQQYLQQGATRFDPGRGEALWHHKFPHQKSGKTRSCVDCHTTSITQPGRHIRTGKTIRPISPAVEARRFSSTKKVEKWFKRNCKWTLGRPCTAQEKGDILSYIQQASGQ